MLYLGAKIRNAIPFSETIFKENIRTNRNIYLFFFFRRQPTVRISEMICSFKGKIENSNQQKLILKINFKVFVKKNIHVHFDFVNLYIRTL